MAFLLSFVQSADLIHTHDHENESQFDCEICLKVGSAADAIAPSGTELSQERGFVEFLAPETRLTFLSLPAARSRAPPLA